MRNSMDALSNIENLYHEQLNSYSDIEDKKKYLTLLELYKKKTSKSNKNYTQLNPEFYTDLNIYGNDGIFSKINFTHSINGTINLQKILYYPLNKLSDLYTRQNFIKSIVDNPYIQKELEKQLQDFKSLEKDFIWYHQEKTEEHQELLKNVFFQGKWTKFLNNKLWIHRIMSTYNIFISPLICTSSPIFTILLPYLTLRFYYKFPISISNYFKMLRLIFKNMSFSFYSVQNKFQFWSMIGMCFSILSYIHSIYQSCRYSHKLLAINSLLYQKVSSLKKIVFIGTEILRLLNSEVFSVQEDRQNYIKDLLENNKVFLDNTYFKDFQFLNNKIFQHKFLWDKGWIIWAYQECEQIIDKFLPIVNFIGKIDAHLSIIKLYHNYQEQIHSYNFSEFLGNNSHNINTINTNIDNIRTDNNKNYLKIQHFWHPLIHQEKVVSNSLRISKNKNKTVLITGPNAGGKSTIIKSIVLTAYLSQTLTLAPCKQVKLTPFDLIESYFNVPDITGYKSMFEAELYRSKNYLDKLSNNPEIKSLIVLDEIFNSTSPVEGISCSHSIIKRLNSIPNNFSLITTHYHYLTNLEKYPSISNYHVKAKQKNDYYEFPYKIYKGSSTQNIALELLRHKNFDNHIIKDAIYLKDKLNLIKKGIL